MLNVESLNTERNYTSIRCDEDVAARTFWCYMHAHPDSGLPGGRACFTPKLVREICAYQRVISSKIQPSDTAKTGLAHVVLASDSDVFNLGGDLALFAQHIRGSNRPELLRYAQDCVRGVHAFHAGLHAGMHSIALVQGDALGGGFEAALSCHTIVAEEGVGMGLPEVLFDLFPGMGAYSFLSRRIGPAKAERMMLDGRVRTSEELFELGIVDHLAAKGRGAETVRAVIKRNQAISNARRAMHQVREMVDPVSLDELMAITEIWVDTAMSLGEKSLRTMERLVRAQVRRARSHASLAEAI